jgi:hypothetical protein
VSPRQAIIKASWHLKKMHPEIEDFKLPKTVVKILNPKINI